MTGALFHYRQVCPIHQRITCGHAARQYRFLLLILFTLLLRTDLTRKFKDRFLVHTLHLVGLDMDVKKIISLCYS
jgi:hypothetical protein